MEKNMAAQKNTPGKTAPASYNGSYNFMFRAFELDALKTGLAKKGSPKSHDITNEIQKNRYIINEIQINSRIFTLSQELQKLQDLTGDIRTIEATIGTFERELDANKTIKPEIKHLLIEKIKTLRGTIQQAGTVENELRAIEDQLNKLKTEHEAEKKENYSALQKEPKKIQSLLGRANEIKEELNKRKERISQAARLLRHSYDQITNGYRDLRDTAPGTLTTPMPSLNTLSQATSAAAKQEPGAQSGMGRGR
jgi:DNA repair exonuclease SbcCD ATPase subunit